MASGFIFAGTKAGVGVCVLFPLPVEEQPAVIASEQAARNAMAMRMKRHIRASFAGSKVGLRPGHVN